MDYTGTPQLWENYYSPEKRFGSSKFYRNRRDKSEQMIREISFPIGNNNTIIYENNTLTIVRISDTFNEKTGKAYRKLVRTKTISSKNLPKSLLSILEESGFKRIV